MCLSPKSLDTHIRSLKALRSPATRAVTERRSFYHPDTVTTHISGESSGFTFPSSTAPSREYFFPHVCEIHV